MTDDDKSLGDQHTFDGEPSAPSDANSFGDDMTFAGVDAQLDNDLNNDGMEIIDLEKRYKFESELGKGGMGEVLLATDTVLERKVAIKRILGKAVRSAKAYQRFRNGAQAIAALNHPNIVQLYDFGKSTDGPFMILECVNGGSLLDRCKQGAIPLEEAIDITCQLCDGIGKAHAAGIIHRDIKPANVLMTEDGIPKLNDFDLAKEQVGDTGMTQEGAVLGTLDFMPPEQRRDAALVDQRSDLWSLAATLYQMVTGKSPKIIKFKDVPESLHEVLGKALEESQDDRYQNAEEFKNAIQRIISRPELSVSNRLKDVAFKLNCCPCCGVKNKKTRRHCGGCGVDLKAQCYSCEAEIDTWELHCPECGANQAELTEAAMARYSKEQAQAEDHLQQNRYASSHKIATAQHNISDARLHPAKKWAESFLKKIIEVRQKDLNRVVQLINQATSHGEAKDYLSAIQALEQVPEIFATVQFGSQETTPKQLYDLFSEKQEAIVSLEARIRVLIAGNHFGATLPLLDDLFESQPHRKDLTELKDEMLTRQATMMAERDKTFNQAKHFFENNQYGRCRESLSTIDETLVDESILNLDQQAQSNIDRLQELQKTIQLRQNEKDFHGLLKIVAECLALQPGAPEMQALSVQLQEWEDQRLATRKKAFEKAKDHFVNHHYVACLSSLTVIDDSLVDEPVLTLRNQAKSRVKQIQELRRRIETAQEQYETLSAEGKPCSKKIQALITLLSKLLELDPNGKHFIELHQQLAEHAERLKETRKQAFAEAQQYFDTQNYQDSLSRIDDIDTDLHDQEVVALRRRAADDFNRLQKLRGIIQQRVEEKNLEPLLPLLEECLVLQPAAVDIQKLYDQLSSWDARIHVTRNAAVAKAKQFVDSHNYKGALEELARIDSNLIDQELKIYQDSLQAKQTRVEFLLGEIKSRVGAEKYRNVTKLIDELLRLQPELTNMVDLRSQVRVHCNQVKRNRIFTISLLLVAAIAIALILFFIKDELLMTLQSKDPPGTASVDNVKQENTDINNAIAVGDYSAVLRIDPNNAKALAMKKQADAIAMKERNIQQALASGDYQAALALDPKNLEALTMKREDEYKQAKAGKEAEAADRMRASKRKSESMRESEIRISLKNGDYQAVLDLEPDNPEALAMKKEDEIKQLLDKGYYRAALALDSKNPEALAMKKETEVKQALASGDYEAVLDLEPENAEALTMKKEAEIKQALASGDYRRVLALDSKNPRALAMKRETEIKQALASGDYLAVLDLDPDNAEAIVMKMAAIQRAILNGDFETTLELDPRNTEAAKLKQAASTMQKPLNFYYQTARIYKVAFSPDGLQVASGTYDKKVKLWEAKTGKDLNALVGHTANVHSVAFSPNGQQIVSGSWDDTLKLWDGLTGKDLRTFTGHTGNVYSVAMSPDGHQIASGSADKTIKLWDVQSGKELRTLTGHRDRIHSVVFSPGGQQIVSGSWDDTIKLWDAQTGKELRTFTVQTGNVYSVAFSPDGQQIASSGTGQTIQLWDVRTGKERRTFTGHTDRVNSVAFSPNGQHVVSGSNDQTIKLWDVETGKELTSLAGHEDSVNSVAFSPDGHHVVSGSVDTTIKLWEVGDYLDTVDRIKEKYASPSDHHQPPDQAAADTPDPDMSAAPKTSKDTVTADDVVNMHIKQLGGEEKLKSIKTVEQQFVMVRSGPGGDMEADCELVQDGNKFRMTMSLPGLGEIQQGSNGKNYWTSSPAEGDRLMDKEEAALAKEQYSRPFPALDWGKDYDGKINMKGETDVDGTKCYKLEFVPAVGSPITRYFAVEDGKILRFDTVQKGGAGEIAIRVFLSDFKPVDGIMLPFKQETKMEQASMTMEVDSIKFNEAIKAERFKLPAAIQKLVDEKK